jgi:hypothetical protein
VVENRTDAGISQFTLVLDRMAQVHVSLITKRSKDRLPSDCLNSCNLLIYAILQSGARSLAGVSSFKYTSD